MPYISRSRRSEIEAGGAPEVAGELNYAITRLVDKYVVEKGLRYQHVNAAVGALEAAKLEFSNLIAGETRKSQGKPTPLRADISNLISMYRENAKAERGQVDEEILGAVECAKLELYRRIAVPYEDQKIGEEGDVYRALDLLKAK